MEGPPEASRVTFVITATNAGRLPDVVAARGGLPRRWSRVTDMLDRFGTPMDAVPLLTDDYSPVESLIADLLIGPND